MNELNRRRFIQGTTAAAVGIAWDNPLFAADAAEAGGPPDLVAMRNGGAVEMFEAGIALLGGMAAFVKKGQNVVVKPNIGWDQPPEIPANTNPELVGAIVRHCLKAGAAKVTVFDHTCNQWEKCYANSGIEAAVKAAGGEMAPGNHAQFYQDKKIAKAKLLKEVKIHRQILECDVFINVPVLKHHGGAKLTIAMKNLMGVVLDRQWWHRNGLDQCIAEYCLYPRLPDLNIVDAFRILRKHGPRGRSLEDGEIAKYQLLGRDIVAIDAAATKLFGMNPEDIGYIKMAGELGIGRSDLDKVRIKRVTLPA
jgi:uncharacterized protein (DUF362 family)